MALLAIDVGNTRLKWALFDRPGPGAVTTSSGPTSRTAALRL